MKKRVLAIAATAMATMMMASPVMAQDFKIGICNYVDDASLNPVPSGRNRQGKRRKF